MSTPCFPVATSRVEGSPSCVNYSKDGKLCIIGTTNGTVKLFENSETQAIATLPSSRTLTEVSRAYLKSLSQKV